MNCPVPRGRFNIGAECSGYGFSGHIMSTNRAKTLLDDLAELERLRDPAKSRGLRQYRRFVVRTDAELHPMDPTHIDRMPIEVKLRDISRGGAGFVCSRNLAFRSVWRLVILHRGYAVSEMAVVIRHGRDIRDGVYLMGGQFGAETGAMVIAGVDPLAITTTDADADAEDVVGGRFVDPDHVR